MTRDRCVVCGAGVYLGRPMRARDASAVSTGWRPDATPRAGLRRVDAAARLRALAGSWHDGDFHCFYTGVSLIEDHGRWRDHRYLVFEGNSPATGQAWWSPARSSAG